MLTTDHVYDDTIIQVVRSNPWSPCPARASRTHVHGQCDRCSNGWIIAIGPVHLFGPMYTFTLKTFAFASCVTFWCIQKSQYHATVKLSKPNTSPLAASAQAHTRRRVVSFPDVFSPRMSTISSHVHGSPGRGNGRDISYLVLVVAHCRTDVRLESWRQIRLYRDQFNEYRACHSNRYESDTQQEAEGIYIQITTPTSKNNTGHTCGRCDNGVLGTVLHHQCD